MLVVETSVESRAAPEAIWAIWEDVANWSSWDGGIEYSSIEGPFAAGTRGILKPKGGPRLKTCLTEVNKNEGFVDETKFLGTRIIVSHKLEKRGGLTRVTNRVEMKGLLAPLLWLIVDSIEKFRHSAQSGFAKDRPRSH